MVVVDGDENFGRCEVIVPVPELLEPAYLCAGRILQPVAGSLYSIYQIPQLNLIRRLTIAVAPSCRNASSQTLDQTKSLHALQIISNE